MSLWKSIKKIFKKLLPILPVILLFAGPNFLGGKLGNIFKFATKGKGSFLSRNLFKALTWGYSIYSALNPPKPPSFSGGGDYSDEPVYSWDGADLTSQSNIPVQVVYGDWWVDNGNVIDKEISTKTSIDPSTSTLYLKETAFKYEGKETGIGEDKINIQVSNVTTIENGTNKGTIIGFDEVSHDHVWFDDTNNSWEKFDYVSMYAFDSFHNENYLETVFKNNAENIDSKNNCHSKFVFTPEDNHILSFMTKDYAMFLLFRMDINNKKVYIYVPDSILMNESGQIFDYNRYEFQKNLSFHPETNFGFSKSIIGNNKLNSENKFMFHKNNVIRKYDINQNETFTNQYTPDKNIRDGNYNENNIFLLRSTFLNLTFKQRKILDGVIHYHNEFNEFSLQILVEDKFNNRFDKNINTGATRVTDPIYNTGNLNSNRNNTYILGLRFHSKSSLLFDNSYQADMESIFNSDTIITSAIINRGFYGLFTEFSVYNDTTLTPSTKQTEIRNLAYLSFKDYNDGQMNVLKSSTGRIGSWTNLLNHTSYYQPIPSVNSQIYRDRYPRIEKLSSQGQPSNWLQKDLEGYHNTNKSIGAICSMIIFDDKNLPKHISYSFMSCLCHKTTESRFDPFFVEVANFSSLSKSSYISTQSYYDFNNKIATQQNTTKSEEGVKSATVNTFVDIKESERNISKINVDGNYISENGYYIIENGYYKRRPTRDTIQIDSIIDEYLWDYGNQTKIFYDYNNQLQCSDIIYIPEHQYHLVKIDNTWVPIRGWSQYVNWSIREIPSLFSYKKSDILAFGLDNNDTKFYVYGGSTDTDNRTLFNTLGYNNLAFSYSIENNFEMVKESGSKTMLSGYVADVDGQIPKANPIIINEKLYWFDNNDIFRNISDNNTTMRVNSTYLENNKVNYITVGWWNNLTPSQQYNNNPSMIYGPKINGLTQNNLNTYRPKLPSSSDINVIYEPIVRNNNLVIV